MAGKKLTAVRIRYTPGEPVEAFTPIHPSTSTRILALLGVGARPELQMAADARSPS